MATNSPGIRVLIVEDNPIIAEDLTAILSASGYEISGVAYSYTEAMDVLMNREIDFAILDVNLGVGYTGLDVAKVISSKYNLPFIFLTSHDDDHTLAEAEKYKPSGYLVKPFYDGTLLSTLRMAISKHEFNILQLLLNGLSYKSIGKELYVSVNTVKHHIKSIYLKLEVNSRGELYSRIF